MLTLLSKLRISRYFTPILFISDLVVLNSAYILSVFMKYGSIEYLWRTDNKSFVLISNMIWIALIIYHKAFKFKRVEPIFKSLNRLFKILIWHTITVICLLIVFKYQAISKLGIVYFFIFFSIGIILYRYAFLKMLKFIRSKGYNFKKVVIYGTNEFGNKLAEVLGKDVSMGYKVEGFFDIQKNKLVLQAPYLGDLSYLNNYLGKEKIDELYVCVEQISKEVMQTLIIICEKYMVRIKFIPNFQQFTQSKTIDVLFYDNIPVIKIRNEPLENPFMQLLKRLFDVAFSLASIILIFPWLFPIIMLAIKISSPGPIFFMQERSGENNSTFTCLKFRTMRVNEFSDSQQAMQMDPRITKVGAFLRKTNIDEFPQFFNVLAGSMSIVGPRPHMLKHTEKYSDLLSNYLVRHFSKPGITGWAQVNGNRGETKELVEMKNRVELDIFYIENWNFFLDIKIILLTIKNMLKGDAKAF